MRRFEVGKSYEDSSCFRVTITKRNDTSIWFDLLGKNVRRKLYKIQGINESCEVFYINHNIVEA